MAIAEKAWSDFVVYTSKGIAIEKIMFDKLFWEKQLLPWQLFSS